MFRITNYSHDSIMVNDVEQSAKFYRDVLGMIEVSRPPTFDFVGKWFRAGNAEIHLIATAEGKQDSGDKLNHGPNKARARHIAFEVADVDETLQHLKAKGVLVITGPRPRGDGAIQLYVHDPDGHLIELCTKAG